MFKIHIFRENFNKILVQCSFSKHANILQLWGYNCNKTKLVCIDANIRSIKTLKNVQKMKNMNSMPLFMSKKPMQYIYMLFSNFKRLLCKIIFISHHAMCSSISSYCCNHLSSMLMSVKLIMIQLELNDIVYKLVFHSYSKLQQQWKRKKPWWKRRKTKKKQKRKRRKRKTQKPTSTFGSD